jgi:hypothetical protein
MITPDAIAAIHWLFEKSIRDHSLSGPDDLCEVAVLPDVTYSAGVNRHLVALTISSYLFRIVALFDFGQDSATLAHLAKLTHSSESALEGQALDDAYAELVNMICGGVNRGLSAVFRHSGMSTPFVLESTCAGYLKILEPTRCSTFRVTINGSVRFDLLLSICLASDTTLDFSIDRDEAEGSAAGELELF